MSVEILTAAAAADKIRIYLRRDTLRPYFVVADVAQECRELAKIFGDFNRIYVSDFCAGDSLLDSDLLVEELSRLTADTFCFGLGEYIYFTGQENILRSLQDKNFGQKIIFVCRGIAHLLERLADEDFKFRANQICRVAGRESFDVTKYDPAINIATDARNFAELLKLLESGGHSATVQTNLSLANVKAIDTFYDALQNREPNFIALIGWCNVNDSLLTISIITVTTT